MLKIISVSSLYYSSLSQFMYKNSQGSYAIKFMFISALSAVWKWVLFAASFQLFSYHVDLGVFVSTFSNSVYTWVLMFLSCLILFRLGYGCFYIVSFCLDLGLVVVDCKVFLFYVLMVFSLEIHGSEGCPVWCVSQLLMLSIIIFTDIRIQCIVFGCLVHFVRFLAVFANN